MLLYMCYLVGVVGAEVEVAGLRECRIAAARARRQELTLHLTHTSTYSVTTSQVSAR